MPLDEARKKIRGNLCVLTGAGAGGGFVRCDTGAAFRKDADTLKAKRSDTAASILKARELAKADGKPKSREEIRKIIAGLTAKQRASIGAERAGIVAARVQAAADKAQAALQKAKAEREAVTGVTGMTPALQKALKKLQSRFPDITKENGKDWGKESVYFEKKVDPTLIDAVKKWASKLDYDEKHAIKIYTGSSYVRLNQCLANNNCDSYDTGIVKTLSAVLVDGPKLSKETVAWRGTAMRPEIAGAIEAFKSGKKKATISSPVFMSASLDPQIAHTFATNYSNNVMLRIRNHGTYVDPISVNPGEQETIYPPGKFRVVNVHKVEPKMYGDPIAYTVVDLEPIKPKKGRRLAEGEENPAHHYAAAKYHTAEYKRLMKDPGPGPVKPEDRIVKGSLKKRINYEVPWGSEIEDLKDGAFDDVMDDGELEETQLDEAKKKIAGNLCVNMGQGSGGGFTACGGASGGHTSDDEVGARPFVGFQSIGPRAGSNPGGLFKDSEGTKFYVKWPKTEDHARNEVLAGKLYELAGIKVPELSFVKDGEKIGVASKIVDGLKPAKADLIAGTLPGVKRGFGMDAWLANWDVVGLEYDNLLKGPDGSAMRVDTGGALRYRAQGGPKGSNFGNVVGELTTMRDKYRESGKVFGNMTTAEVKRSVEVVTSLSPAKIESVVRKYGPKDTATREDLLKTLLARRKNMAQQLGIELYETQKKIIGNLCVNTGQGSGGGFTACGGGSGANELPPDAISWIERKIAFVKEANASSFIPDYSLDGKTWTKQFITNLKDWIETNGFKTSESYSFSNGHSRYLRFWKEESPSDVLEIRVSDHSAPNAALRSINTLIGNISKSDVGTVDLRDRVVDKVTKIIAYVFSELNPPGSWSTTVVPIDSNYPIGAKLPKDKDGSRLINRIQMIALANDVVRNAIFEAEGWGFLRKSKPQNPGNKRKSWDWKKTLKPKALSLEAEAPPEGLRDFVRALIDGESLDEARKKLRGNLCVLTGVGSGGGFVPCNSGSFGRSDKPELQAHRKATATSIRDTYKRLKAAIAAGDKDAVDKIRKEAIPGRFSGLVAKATGQKGAKDALDSARAAAEVARKAAEDAAAAAAKKAADDAAAALKKAADDAAKKAADDAAKAATATPAKKEKPIIVNTALFKRIYKELDDAKAKNDQAAIDKIKDDPVLGSLYKSWAMVRKYQADDASAKASKKAEADAAALQKKLDAAAKPKAAPKVKVAKTAPKVEVEHEIYGKTTEGGYTLEFGGKLGDAKPLVGSKKDDPGLNAQYATLKEKATAAIESHRVYLKSLGYSDEETAKRLARYATFPLTPTPIDEFEKTSILAKKESAAIYDLAGNMLIHKNGSATEVAFSHAEVMAMKDAVLTHNHPNSLGFSDADINLMVKANMAELRAVGAIVNEKGKVIARVEYSLKRPANGWNVKGKGKNYVTWTAKDSSDPSLFAKSFSDAVKSNLRAIESMGIPVSAYSYRVVDLTDSPAMLKAGVLPPSRRTGKVSY